MHRTRDPAPLMVFHRVDDPWSYLLMQALGRLAETYSVAFTFVTVPLPGPEFAPRPEFLSAHAVRDAADLSRHLDLTFPDPAVAPDVDSVDLANRMLMAQPDPDSYLQAALDLGAALFSGDRRALEERCKSLALASSEETRQSLSDNAAAQVRMGHYHSAMIHFAGGWYWGIDRLSHLEQVLIAMGFRKPTGVPGVVGARREPILPPVVGIERDAGGEAILRFYCSFRSPYAYVAARRAFALGRRFAVRVDPRLIIPMKMAGFPVPRIKAEYFRMDCAREALRYGVRFGRFTDPFGVGLRAAMSLFPHAAREGRAEAYILSVMEGIWADGLDTARPADLSVICARAGLEPEAATAIANPSADLTWADRHREELAGLGHYAAPVFVLGDYVTWGQDRLPILERVLDDAVGYR